MRKLTMGLASVLSLVLASRTMALTTAFVDFETNPPIAAGPSEFSAAGPAQSIVVPGVATFTGGLVLGDETFLPALSFGTPPNVYATASTSVIPKASPTLDSSVTVTIAPTFTVDEISFPLFNGMQAVESYTIDAFDGSTQVGQEVLSDLATNNSSGHGVVDLKATDITSVTISPSDLSAGWDFSIDSVAFNEPVSAAINPNGTPITPGSTGGNPGTGSVVPLPPSGWSAAAMLAGLAIVSCVQSRRNNRPMGWN
jgi:hypothetical protein